MGNQYTDSPTLKLQRALFSSNTTSKSEIIAAPGENRKIRVMGYLMSGITAVGAEFYAGTTGTTLSPVLKIADGGNIGEPVNEYPKLDDLPENVNLCLALDAQQTVGGIVHYHIVHTKTTY